ncbi:cell division topological specificity factor MinE [Aureimonas leprariae]|uniref:Cell division topological specificity factor n=1 Tax=Plantimonas leprariae TaxID=2615207 RepID=A0A7V7PNS9_9HYPH|nr:cell division topological specificity factor MinE [Aureimonas leprariae]KAB0679388.1 cell division topological specificity factor MinE [Aureimonas leprariae]
MSLFSLFQRKASSAPAARERLQVLLQHERAEIGQADLVQVLREEIIAVIAKHVSIDRDKVGVKMDRGASVSTLAVDIELPSPPGRPALSIVR